MSALARERSEGGGVGGVVGTHGSGKRNGIDVRIELLKLPGARVGDGTKELLDLPSH